MSDKTLRVIDNRTGKEYTTPIVNNAVASTFFKTITVPEGDGPEADQESSGIRCFDPGFQNTAVSKSKIAWVDGKKGTIQYRGYPIEDLIGKKSYPEVCYLLIWGKIPTAEQAEKWEKSLTSPPKLDQSVYNVIRSFPSDAPPMSMVMAGMAALQGVRKERIPAVAGKNLYCGNLKRVDAEIPEVMSSMALISAIAYCHSTGKPFSEPRSDLSFIENIFYMMGHNDPETGLPNPLHVQCLDKLWVLVADHEMTCSTASFLHTASALPDPITGIISALAASYGILHGGAIEVAYRNIAQVGSIENCQAKIDGVKAGKERLFGYGHRIYKTVDPRSVYIREVIAALGEEVQKDPLLKVAFELDRIAQSDEYFIKRKLNPNADLFASFAYSALGFPPDFILCLSAICRTFGLMAHWREAMSETPLIWRPQQLYVGETGKSLADL